MGRWSKQGCINSAREYDDLKTWIRDRKTAYLAARDNGWLDQCCAHMGVNTSNKQLTLVRYLDFSREHQSKVTWLRSDEETDFAAASRNGWILECTAHMKPLKKVRTLESCKVAANKFKSLFSWYYSDPSTYVYACRHGWMEECCLHMQNHMDLITKNMCMESAASFDNFKEFSKNDYIHFTSAKKNGWLPQIKNIYYERNISAWIEKNLGGAGG